MSHFTIEMLSDQCGVSMPNLRAWQRSGLLQPMRDDSGRRYFDYSHLMRIHAILKWLDRGLPLDEISRILKGEKSALVSQWEVWQEQLLATLEKTSMEKGRALLRKMGRELPAAMLLDKVVQPLRLWLNHGHTSAQLTRRARFDTLIIEYATFLMQALRKRPASGLVVMAMNSHDPLNVWLEAIRFSGEGFRIDVMHQPVPLPDLTQFAADHYLVYSDVPLTPAQLALWQQWQLDGMPLFSAGAGFAAAPELPDAANLPDEPLREEAR
ncbi:MerR family transcriptional regulator [Cronobacter turicensis]|uniref:MerR family DNA-binding transcriptional regulator n=2 Tax=Cronobacter turicensis TaxID=413502 RepID=A0A2T7AZX2_9ENTR|nr:MULTISPECIES: MerR family transcriptional regulator [Cronobacter]EKM0667954.1 MerR family transcriptional regulator [Cronobacter turicensis]EKY3178675.1 MerR family transcriptional regulator [Cronobacter turicensis]ELQ6221837.1 MerR family transcriptional regulator [Cronobacter turicensis]ELQ6226945.1 MerR family transcriptional regulator [Cronobacter turicensis]ELY2784222.1 MerR family transcriptional regulator [Cronobacter turicensis]